MSKTTAKTDEPQASTTTPAEATKQDASAPVSDAQGASDAPTTDDAAQPTAEAPARQETPKAKGSKKAKSSTASAASKAKPAATKKKKPAKDTPTLEDLGHAFFAALEKEGKSDSTLSSYKMDFALAVRELGAKTRIGTLTPAKVQAYFDSEVVTRTRTGRVKAKPTIDKTRRVLRLALWFAEEQGMVEKAPVPEPAA